MRFLASDIGGNLGRVDHPTLASEFIKTVPVVIGALLAILGKIAFGALTDRVSPRLVATAGFGLAAAGTLFLLGSASALDIAAFAVVYGLPMGGIAALQPVLVAEYFGPSSFGTVYGTLVLLLTLGAAAGPVIAGRVYDLGGGYQPTLVACSLASGAAAFLMMAAKRSAIAEKSGITAESSHCGPFPR